MGVGPEDDRRRRRGAQLIRTAARPAEVTGAWLRVKRLGQTSAPLQLSLETSTGSALASSQASAQDISNESLEWVHVRFPRPARLDAGAEVALRAGSPAPSAYETFPIRKGASSGSTRRRSSIAATRSSRRRRLDRLGAVGCTRPSRRRPAVRARRPVTVCHVTVAHDAWDARIFHKECATLAAAGYRVVLVAPHGRREIRDGVAIEPLRSPRSRLDRLLGLQARAAVAAARQRAALYHVHDPELIPLALLARVLWRKRVVFDMHELHSEDLVARLGRIRPPARSVLRLVLERWPLRVFDLVVFATEALRREMPAPRAGVTLLNLPTVGEGERVGGALPWAQRRYDVIHLGSISAPRLRLMLEVARRVAGVRPQLTWLFLGIGPAAVEWARANHDAAFLERHVVFRAPVPHLEALDHVRSSRVGFTYHPGDPPVPRGDPDEGLRVHADGGPRRLDRAARAHPAPERR